ncbi:FHA domain-containing protein [Rhizobium leguminosarum]|uniref:FHA domain-containing protein n=1 Tax=Rhizobium leguminosarum TaxID=384 RepID=UPI001C96BDB8|nr:FHA domain-containing protein [Rhizobium leguminosarum]MBY5918467.1 FHA domain-containing protein [Rhizobium leguminosarum]
MLGFAVLVFVVRCGQAGAADETAPLKASLHVEGQKAVVDWRFAGDMPAPLKSLSVSVHGRPLIVSKIQSYPAEGDRTVMMFLVDTTGDAARQENARRSKARLVGLYEYVQPHHVVAIGAIGDGVRLAIPKGGIPMNPLLVMAQLQMTPVEPDLSAAISFATDALADNEASRRAAFIFTDGHSVAALNSAPLIAAAKAAGVTLNFVVEPSARHGERDALMDLASRTGGVYVEGESADRFMRDPFRYVDSGAVAEIPFSDARRYPWEGPAELEVVFDYGQTRRVLTSDVTLVNANLSETAQYLWVTQSRPIMLSAVGAGWLFAFSFFLLWRSNRRSAAPSGAREADRPAESTAPRDDQLDSRKSDEAEPALHLADSSSQPAPEPAPAPLAASAVPTLRIWPSNGEVIDFPLTGSDISIGRASANDIVVPEATVSSRQARLTLDGSGRYRLINLSATNPSQINGEAVEDKLLNAGDSLDFGGIRAEFLIALPNVSGDRP